MKRFPAVVLKSAVLLSTLAITSTACLRIDRDGFDPREPSPDDGSVAEVPSEPIPPVIAIDPDGPDRYDPVPSVFADKQLAPQSINVIGDSLYWVDRTPTGSALRWIHTDGGEWATVDEMTTLPFDAVVDDTGVFLTSTSNQRVLFAHHGDPFITQLHSSFADPLAVDVSDFFVVWTDVNGCIVRGAKEGGDPDILACDEGSPVSVAVAGDLVYWTTIEGNLYVTSLEPTEQVAKLVGGENFTSKIVVDDDRIYWVDDLERAVRSVSRAGGEVQTLATAQFAPAAITQDRFHLYFTTQADGAVKSLAKAGGEVHTLASGQLQPGDITVDDEFVYWLNEGDGTVMRIVKW